MKKVLSDKKYYSIGEVAEFLNVNTSLLRFWEKEFKQISPKKKKSGIRKFTKPDVEILQNWHIVRMSFKWNTEIITRQQNIHFFNFENLGERPIEICKFQMWKLSGMTLPQE